METVWLKVRWIGGWLWLLCGLGVLPQAHAQAPLSAEGIIQKAVARTQSPQAVAQVGFSYSKVTVVEELDAAGKVKERKEKLYRVCFRDGTSWGQLLEVNGRPPAAADRKKQVDNEGAVNLLLGQSKANKGDNRERFLTPELAAHYEFTLLGEAPVNGRMAYQLAFRPKDPEMPVHHLVDRLLNRISGKIWVDAEEFEVAAAEVRLGSQVDFLGGAIGCLRKMVYSMTRTRVAEGVWLNTSSSGNFEGRKLLESLRIKTYSQCKDFKPLA